MFSEVNSRDEAALNALPLSWARIGGSRSGLSPLSVLRHSLRVRSELKGYSPDVVLTYQIAMVIGTCLATFFSRKSRVAALFPGLGVLFQADRSSSARWRMGLARALAGVALKRVDVAVFQNHDDLADLSSGGLLARDCHAVVVPGSGVDLQLFSPGPWPETPAVFTIIGRLLRSKGFEVFVTAAREVSRRRPGQVKFRIVGGLDEHPDAITADEVGSWCRQEDIDYAGYTDSITAELHKCTAVVLPTTYMEGLPRTILEAMACGRAVITTDWRGCRDAVEDGVTGRLVSPGDSAAVAEAMLAYVDDPNLALEHGRNGRLRAETSFSSLRVGSLMADAVEACVRAPSGGEREH